MAEEMRRGAAALKQAESAAAAAAAAATAAAVAAAVAAAASESAATHERAVAALRASLEEESRAVAAAATVVAEAERTAALQALRDELGAAQQAALATAAEAAAAEAASVAAENDHRRAVAVAARGAEADAALEKLAADKDAEAAAAVAVRECALREEAAAALAAATERRQATAAVAAAVAERDAAKQLLETVEARGRAAQEAALAAQQKRLEEAATAAQAALAATKDAEVAAAAKLRDEAKELYTKETKARRAIHNALMDLKGNIRVMARVRPVLEVERLQVGADANVTEFPSDEDIVVQKDEATRSRFEYDRVFTPASTQAEVFSEVQALVMSCLDGYNVTLLAYGQTGSGKTHTMEGTAADPGVNTRALAELFRVAADRAENVEYSFTLSMLEVYNETVRDLLDSTAVAGKTAPRTLEVRQAASGAVGVPGLTDVAVTGMAEVMEQLRRGKSARAVGAHDMNEHSSRSHMMVGVSVTGRNRHNGTELRSRLGLIDLAGSERVGKTDATGDRLKEAQNINRSLSALGDVIAALASKNKAHVPFRNSKLTFLLQDALSGTSKARAKVVMFVCASPSLYNVGETICSLTFAARCRAVELGAAKKNQDSSEVARLRRTVADLQSQLAAAGAGGGGGTMDGDGEGGGGEAGGSSGGSRSAASSPSVLASPASGHKARAPSSSGSRSSTASSSRK
ncbi:unnamed protein product [Phaeothamnion confervicola]